ncbi:MAG: hypothetical protein KY434_05785 [Actinobacteria bacterium]|nr:hypothetical protein [Actinomycetota bacterium]
MRDAAQLSGAAAGSTPASIHQGRVDDRPATLRVTGDVLDLGDAGALAWTEVDGIDVGTHDLHLDLAGGPRIRLHHLARAFDRAAEEIVDAWSTARRKALLQHPDVAPLDIFRAKRGAVPARVCLFGDRLTVEPWRGVPDIVPFSLLTDVQRDGWELALQLRGLQPVVVRHLGARTDEFLERLAGARRDLEQRTAGAYAEFDPALAQLPAADGWAVDEAAAGPPWSTLRGAFDRLERADEVRVLEALAGARLRLGLKARPGGLLPFALAPVGHRVVVEGAAADDRATFVFATTDVDRLNAVLLLTSFRREALSLPEERLGRWALAVRLLEHVRWARAALAARVVHDGDWEGRLHAALA